MAASAQGFAETPTSTKKLRACIDCKLIKTLGQFKARMCENCKPDGASMGEGERSEWTEHHTTTEFFGTVALMEPSGSWVARWNQMAKVTESGSRVPLVGGVYAVEVSQAKAMAAAQAEQDEYAEGAEAEDDPFIATEGEEEDEGEEATFSAAEGSGEGSGGEDLGVEDEDSGSDDDIQYAAPTVSSGAVGTAGSGAVPLVEDGGDF